MSPKRAIVEKFAATPQFGKTGTPSKMPESRDPNKIAAASERSRRPSTVTWNWFSGRLRDWASPGS